MGQKDPDIEQALGALGELKDRLNQWIGSGPHQLRSARVGGVTAEATLADGLTSLEIDHYWLQTAQMTDVAECTTQAVAAVEQACRNQYWEVFEGIRIGEFSPSEFSEPGRMQQFMNDPKSFFEGLGGGVADSGRGTR